MTLSDWVGIVGGTFGVVSTILVIIRSWNRRDFDSEQVMKDLKELQDANLANRVHQLEESQLEIKKNMYSDNQVILESLKDLNRHVMDLTRAIGRLEGMAKKNE